MTKNQIEYMKYKEDQRHNLATEGESQRSNLANEDLTKRRDSGTLELRRAELDEAIRHNKFGEAINFAVNEANVKETNRSNLAREAETSRHNQAAEEISKQQVGASYLGSQAAMVNAGAAVSNAEIRAAELNALMDYRNSQIGLGYAQLGEQHDYNQGSLGIAQQNADIAQQNADTNRQNANLRGGELDERVRHDRNTEKIDTSRTALDFFSNIVKIGVG